MSVVAVKNFIKVYCAWLARNLVASFGYQPGGKERRSSENLLYV